MSVSTDGILVFGVDLGEEMDGMPWQPDKEYESDEDADTDDDADIESWWAAQNGVSSSKLWEEYYAWAKEWKTGDWRHDEDSVKVFEELNPEWRKALDKYYADNKAIQEKLPIEIVMHCSGEYPMYFLAVKGYTTSASRGYPKVVSDLDVKPEDLKAAQDFCKKYDIPFENPTWHLASLWS